MNCCRELRASAAAGPAVHATERGHCTAASLAGKVCAQPSLRYELASVCVAAAWAWWARVDVHGHGTGAPPNGLGLHAGVPKLEAGPKAEARPGAGQGLGGQQQVRVERRQLQRVAQAQQTHLSRPPPDLVQGALDPPVALRTPGSRLVALLAVLGLTTPVARSASTATRAAVAAYAVVDGCGASDRLCLAYPDGCSATKNCTTVATVIPPSGGSDRYRFELAAQYTGYVAVALAESTSMGVDSVVECVNDAGTVKVYQSVNKALNPSTGKRGNHRLPSSEQVGVTLDSSSLKDGVVACAFYRDAVTTVNGTKYDLQSGSWVLQAAAGNRINKDTSIHHHLEWVVSPGKVKLSDTGLVQGSYGSRREEPAPTPSAAGPGPGATRTRGLLPVMAVLLTPLLTLLCT
ncbi:Putative ferric-chelate reductase 1-like protein [Frankliniella fusca]|uniref:Ferric-chelate reductase 1-like protein n=1 Tax=Frankliniella fusca TaxID=407009 RepID=A0AAE1LI23_9NEOP|nr:Putative ferric-chelate reductase 1-like protein [Frankliniella fusca]